MNRSSCNADETPGFLAGKDTWLWVLLRTTIVLFAIGPRSKATFASLLGTVYTGWLMTDGYRDYPKRLRCWAHLLRKAQGLVDSLTPGRSTTAARCSHGCIL